MNDVKERKQIMKTSANVQKRNHRMLFDSNLPFRGRRETSKIQYRRQPKHKGREQ